MLSTKKATRLTMDLSYNLYEYLVKSGLHHWKYFPRIHHYNSLGVFCHSKFHPRRRLAMVQFIDVLRIVPGLVLGPLNKIMSLDYMVAVHLLRVITAERRQSPLVSRSIIK